jgi:hypothetical protein
LSICSIRKIYSVCIYKMVGGFFGTLKLFITVGAYFAAFQLGKMAERPKSQWPKAKPGQNPLAVGDWAAYQKIFMGMVAVAVLLALMGPGGFGGMMGGLMGGGFGGGYGGGGYY